MSLHFLLPILLLYTTLPSAICTRLTQGTVPCVPGFKQNYPFPINAPGRAAARSGKQSNKRSTGGLVSARRCCVLRLGYQFVCFLQASRQALLFSRL